MTATAVESANKLKQLSRIIGNTPLLGIECTFRGKRRVVFAKSEQLNLTGSNGDGSWKISAESEQDDKSLSRGASGVAHVDDRAQGGEASHSGNLG